MLVNMAIYSTASEDDRETGRIKVFDASVFVIAITFLILDTKAPRAADLHGGPLGSALLGFC